MTKLPASDETRETAEQTGWLALVTAPIRAYPVSAAALAVIAVIFVITGIATTLPADGASDAGAQPATPSGADSSATETPTATATATGTATGTATASTPAVKPPPRTATAESDPMGEDPFLLGERIFLTEAGEGIGCSACHGLDGRGTVAAGSPPIRGKFPWEIQLALDNNPVMDFLSLSPDEVEAVSEYLQWLATQP